MRDELSDIFGPFIPELSHEDPVRRAQIQMKKALPKRFYKEVAVAPCDSGFLIQLDGRTVKTPAKSDLAMPNAELAEMVADEWRAQVEVINPTSMPVTRLVNTALDGVAVQIGAVAEEIERFAGTDMLFYRADSPDALVERQTREWDPVLAWASSNLGARFILAQGIIHQQQPAEALSAFSKALKKYHQPLPLSAIHVITTLTGSAVLALAFAEGALERDEVWRLAHLEEDWTIEHWGSDAEAEMRRAKRFEELRAASAVFETLRAAT
ncbi:ATP12 family chaperone protein [Agrobacterium sp. ES01]|uniref:ATP12 family chaperone protein n=1 Tax=Agrobacterium sp. ES01 TaxID=3420714 RepID=UPI003D0BDD0D